MPDQRVFFFCFQLFQNGSEHIRRDLEQCVGKVSILLIGQISIVSQTLRSHHHFRRKGV
jgi:hypothetical protein